MKTVLILAMICLSFEIVHGDVSERYLAKKSDFLNNVIISRVDFKDVTIREAIDFAYAHAAELDDASLDPKRKGVSILLRYPSGEMYPRRGVADLDPPKNPKKSHIVFIAKNVSLSEFFKEVARQTGYDVYTTSVGVVFCPPGSSPFPNASSSKGDVWEKIYDSK